MTSLLKQTSKFFLGGKKKDKRGKEKDKKGNQEGCVQEIVKLPADTQQDRNSNNEADKEETTQENQFRNFGKLFVGGLNNSTTAKDLEAYFSRFGKVIDSVVMTYPQSKKSRGFGFVTFADPADSEICLKVKDHILDGTGIDLRAFGYKESCDRIIDEKSDNRLFLGGLPFNLLEIDLRQFFERYGQVQDIYIPVDRNTKKSKGYGFLSFKDKTAAERCAAEGFVYLKGRRVQIKKAFNRDCLQMQDNISVGNEADITMGLEAKETFTDHHHRSYFSEEMASETRSVASGEELEIFELNPEIQKLFDCYFLSKFNVFNAMNEKQNSDKSVKDQFSNETDEVTEVEKLLADFLINSSEQVGDFEKDLIEFSSETELEDSSSSDAQEDTTDDEEEEEEDGDCSTLTNSNARSFQNNIEQLSAGFTRILMTNPTFSEQHLSDSKSSAPKSGDSAVSMPLKIKNREGFLECRLCHWTTPESSFDNFLAHCRSSAHKAKLKERFPLKMIKDDKPKLELLETNKPAKKGDLKSVLDKSSAESEQSVSKNQKCNKVQRKPKCSSTQSQSKILTKGNYPKSVKTKKEKEVNEQNLKQKREENVRVLKINALAKGIASIQPISESEINCKMCGKIIPRALDFNTLMKNVSHHLQSKGHLKKLLETENSVNKTLEKKIKRKKKAKKENPSTEVKKKGNVNTNAKNADLKQKKVIEEQEKCSKIKSAQERASSLLKGQTSADRKNDIKAKSPSPKTVVNNTRKDNKLKNAQNNFLCLSCNTFYQSSESLNVHINSKSHLNSFHHKNVKNRDSCLDNLGKCKGCEIWLYGSLYDINKHHSKCFEHK